jgi:nucleoside-diphosphate-sugar epimerase
MRLFITGSKGRLGRALCAEFASDGHEVLAFSRTADQDHIALSALEHHLKADTPADYLIHLAWSVLPSTAEEDTGAAWREDIPLLERILSSLESLPLERRPILVFLSSCSVYGDACLGELFSEESPARPKGWYASGKLAAEEFIRLYEHRRGISSLIVRVTNPYGFSQVKSSPQGVIPALLRAAKEQKEFPLWGSRDATKDYIHFKDLYSALMLLMKHRSTGLFNVASGEPVSTANLIQCIQAISGIEIQVREKPKCDWDVVCGRYSNVALRDATGWLPQVSLRSGIRNLVESDLNIAESRNADKPLLSHSGQE